MTLKEIKKRHHQYEDDIKFLIAKIERMQAAILSQVSIDRFAPSKNNGFTGHFVSVYFAKCELKDFFDVEVKE